MFAASISKVTVACYESPYGHGNRRIHGRRIDQ